MKQIQPVSAGTEVKPSYRTIVQLGGIRGIAVQRVVGILTSSTAMLHCIAICPALDGGRNDDSWFLTLTKRIQLIKGG